MISTCKDEGVKLGVISQCRWYEPVKRTKKMSNFQSFKNWLGKVSFLTDKDCDLFEPHLITKLYTAKDYFLENDGTCKEIGFINSGYFRTYYLSDGKEVNTQFIFENEFVTDYDNFLNNKPS